MNKKLIDNVFKFMFGQGNEAYLWGHIDYFEKLIPAEIKPFVDLGDALNIKSWAYQECHNFSAWIRIYTELICNKALNTLSHAEQCKYAAPDLTFTEMARQVIEKAAKAGAKKGLSSSQIETMQKAFKMVLELRHSFQHGGLPTILRRAPIPSGIDLKAVSEMADPRKYQDTKKVISAANSFLELVKGPMITLHQGGKITFSSMKARKRPGQKNA